MSQRLLNKKIDFQATLGHFEKKKSKDISTNDSQCEIGFIKKEIIELKAEINNLKSKNDSLKKILCLKIDKQFD